MDLAVTLELARHPLVAGGVLTLVNLVIAPAVAAWVRSGAVTQIEERFRPLTLKLERLEGVIAEQHAEQMRMVQEFKDHKREGAREFVRMQSELRSLRERIDQR